MALYPLSKVRSRNHVDKDRYEREAIERASTFSISTEIADMDAGDIALATLLYDSYYIGGYVELHADDDGTIVIEKWDDVTGSNQTSISAIATLDGGVDLRGAMATLATTDCLCPAGYKINALTTIFDGTVAGQVTLYFKTVDDLGRNG